MNTASPRQANRGFLPVGMLTVFSGLTLLSAEVVSPTVKIEPRESDELLANPGMGWQTFHRFADDEPNLQGLPSASAYFRFYWREIEPQDGQIDFPRALGVGRCEVAVGVVDPRDRRPAVRLANLGRDSDGWYPVSQVEIVP